jgi:hypothetical protein
MKPAEDLVFITIIERFGPDNYDVSSWSRDHDKMTAALKSAESTTTFSVPTCLLHGSKNVRTMRTRFVPVVGFFILFYPIIFFLLQINLGITYSRPIVEPLATALFFIAIFLFTVCWGFYPRALERGLKFENPSRAKDTVDIEIKNDEYRQLFIEMNQMFIDPISDE